MYCPRCGNEHGEGAVTCPHCGTTLPKDVPMPAAAGADSPTSSPAQGSAAQANLSPEDAAKAARQAEALRQLDAILAAESTGSSGRRSGLNRNKVMGGMMAVIVLIAGGFGLFLRFKAVSGVTHNTPTYQYTTPANQDSRFLLGFDQDEAGAVEAAQQYARSVSLNGLVEDSVFMHGDYADVWLKNPSTGSSYYIILARSVSGKGWSFVSMTEM